MENKYRAGISLPASILHNFWRKINTTLYSINLQNLIASWPLLLEILGNMCILIISFTVCDVMNFENNLSFLIKLFSWMIKKLWKIIKYLQAEKSFENEINRIIHNFERACNCQILSQRIFFCEWTNSITFAATYIWNHIY